jgi:hypothetical protein
MERWKSATRQSIATFGKTRTKVVIFTFTSDTARNGVENGTGVRIVGDGCPVNAAFPNAHRRLKPERKWDTGRSIQ